MFNLFGNDSRVVIKYDDVMILENNGNYFAIVSNLGDGILKNACVFQATKLERSNENDYDFEGPNPITGKQMYFRMVEKWKNEE